MSRRVALVTPLHFGPEDRVGGGERYPLNLARALVAADPALRVDLVAIGSPRRATLQPRLELHVLEPTVASAGYGAELAAGIVEILESADLVHVHQAFARASQVALLTAKVLGLPVAMTDHGGGGAEVERALEYLGAVDLMVLPSHLAADRIAGGRARVTIPGGVDEHRFRPPDRPAVREHLLFAGRLLAHKGVDRLICALPGDLPLVIAGPAPDARYAAYLRALAAGRAVRFVDSPDDDALRDLYQRAWATVLPSVHRDAWGRTYAAPELMGLTALESMACGTPTLVTRTGALPEFVRSGETGFVVDELAELGARAGELATGRLDADELGRAARVLVEAEYGLDVVGPALLAAYERVWAA